MLRHFKDKPIRARFTVQQMHPLGICLWRGTVNVYKHGGKYQLAKKWAEIGKGKQASPIPVTSRTKPVASINKQNFNLISKDSDCSGHNS